MICKLRYDTMNSKTVLVTGADGFIGSHLTRRLVKEGADVFVFAIGNENIKDISDRIKSYNIDITRFKDVKKIIDKIQPEKIYHLAACTDVRRLLILVDKMVQINLQGTLNLLNALDGRYDCFVNTGTCEEYGNGLTPFKENQLPRPVSPYSASKASATMFCHMYYKSLGHRIVTLRPPVIYGPNERSDMLIPQVILSCLKNQTFKMTKGEQTRDFIYVDDVVEAYIKASTTERAIGEVINIGSGKEYKIIDVVKKIVKMMESPIKIDTGAMPYRPGEIMHFYSSNIKAKKILGWYPRVDLDEGLRRTIKWHTDNWKKADI